ncbi:MAG: hypothetical protein AMXMBFR84_49850 [Candidatus Hydrogenedentota bacterium]
MFMLSRVFISGLTLGIMTTMLFSSVASAGPVYSISNGVTYERHGRFVKRIADPARSSHNQNLVLYPAQTRVTYDKGDLGKYERHGRFVKRVVTQPSEGASRAGSGQFVDPVQRLRTIDHIKHVHRY